MTDHDHPEPGAAFVDSGDGADPFRPSVPVEDEMQAILARHQRFRDEALDRLTAEPRPSRVQRVLTIARRVLVALAVAAGIALIVFAFTGGPTTSTPRPVTTGFAPAAPGYTPTPAGKPVPDWTTTPEGGTTR